jgi:hypothetical protein
MATETEQPQAEQGSRGGLKRKLARRALEPVVASAVTAASAYLSRKAVEIVREKLLPRLEEKGGAAAVAQETLETVTEKVTPVTEKVKETVTPAAEKVKETVAPVAEKVTEKVTPDGTSGDDGREQERQRREQRRKQRRRALEQSAGSS